MIKNGGVIAYPTESCFGLGCNPRNYHAVKKILRLKKRSSSKGMIVIGSDLSQLKPFFSDLSINSMNKMNASWPAPISWLVPAANCVPDWLKGDSNKIAVRVPDHKLARDLCRLCGHALVSTSANQTGQRPRLSAKQVTDLFGDEIDYTINASCGGATAPSTIVDLESGQVIR